LPLVEEGFARSLTEAATRFAISHPAMGSILVGMATPYALTVHRTGNFLPLGPMLAVFETYRDAPRQ
jgi:hypothetical protein